MYRKISKLITSSLVSNNIINKDDEDVYAYGFEVLISSLISTIVLLIIAILTNTFLYSLLFIIGFVTTRMCCGGYHAKHHSTCLLTTLFNYLIFLSTITFLPKGILIFIIPILISIYTIIILILAPLEHPFNPFTVSQKKRLKVKIIILLSILICTNLICLLKQTWLFQLLSINIGVFSVAISLIAAKIEEKVKNNFNYS